MRHNQLRPFTVGGAHTVIIAEVADSHGGSLEVAKRMIEAAKAAGADAVKFQLHLPDVEMVPGAVRMWDGDLYEILQRFLLTPEQHEAAKQYCESVGILYLCTPFCPTAVDVLEGLGVQAYKTGSGELTHLPLQRKVARVCAQRGVFAFVSTGMCTLDEIAETVAVYEEEGAKERLVLMHCVSEYPPKYAHMNLTMLQRLRERFGVSVGHSDHTPDCYTAYAAVALGAVAVEKHFTLGRNQDGPDHAFSLEPSHLAELVEGIRKIEVGLDAEKMVTREEQAVRDWAHHSVTTVHAVRAGELITLENVAPKRPGGGIPAKYLDQRYAHGLIGKRAKHDLAPNTLLQWEDVDGVDLARVQRTAAGVATRERVAT